MVLFVILFFLGHRFPSHDNDLIVIGILDEQFTIVISTVISRYEFNLAMHAVGLEALISFSTCIATPSSRFHLLRSVFRFSFFP